LESLRDKPYDTSESWNTKPFDDKPWGTSSPDTSKLWGTSSQEPEKESAASRKKAAKKSETQCSISDPDNISSAAWKPDNIELDPKYIKEYLMETAENLEHLEEDRVILAGEPEEVNPATRKESATKSTKRVSGLDQANNLGTSKFYVEQGLVEALDKMITSYKEALENPAFQRYLED
jgi:hypothetical protein